MNKQEIIYVHKRGNCGARSCCSWDESYICYNTHNNTDDNLLIEDVGIITDVKKFEECMDDYDKNWRDKYIINEYNSLFY